MLLNTDLNLKSTPIVEMYLELKSPSANLLRIDDFPTDEDPTITILKI